MRQIYILLIENQLVRYLFFNTVVQLNYVVPFKTLDNIEFLLIASPQPLSKGEGSKTLGN